jgi:hypothetical protein
MINDETMQRLRTELLSALFPDISNPSEELYVDTKAKFILDDILQALAAEIERAEVEARIDEVNLMPPIFGPYKRERLRVLQSKTGGDNANRSDT